VLPGSLRDIRIEPMGLGDLEEVLRLEREAFKSPWTRGMFLAELEAPEGRYLVARKEGELVGYGGIRVFLDEAHLMTLAVREDLRRRGLGTLLLAQLIREAARGGARFMTLEVRRSNLPAISLYRKFGFRVAGIRRGYYGENGEDALVMEATGIDGEGYKWMLDRLECFRGERR
jgi:ribosomal-protein-alanine N-acetyltransferase